MKTSLHKDLASGGWHSSLMTTYSVDPTFYEAFIERRLRRSGCENNILLADAAMLSCAIQATPEAFRLAGRRYAVVPVTVPGCFHPKVHLRLGRDRGRLIIGSANATAAGWCRNLEVLADLDWGQRDKDQTCGPLIRKSYDYLMHWLGEAHGDAVQYKCRMIERESPWLRDITANTSDVELDDGSSIDIFCEHGGDSPSILKQLVKRVAGERIRRLVLISPYWDANLRGLRELRKALSECPTLVALNPEKSHFPVDVLRRKDDLQFVELTTGIDSKRFPHAKVVLVETSEADHVLFGSANCSDDALGLMGGVARNAEVSVYRRLKPGTVRETLALDLRRKLHRSSISLPIAPDSPAENDNKLFDAGYLEISGRVVGWYPPAGIDGTGAMIRLDGADAPVRVANGQLRAEFRDAPTGPLIARVALKSGQMSFPIVVHDENALRRAAPGQIDSRLRETFDRIRKGEEDLLDLAQYAHMIFAADPAHERAKPGRQRGRRSQTSDEKGVVYHTADEFRRAIALEPASGSTGRFSVDDPGLLQVLSIIMRGVGGVEAPEDREVLDDQEDAHLEAGDVEDDGTQSGGEKDDSDEQRDMPRSSTGGPRYFTVEQITRRRSRLKKTMDSFQELLTRLAADPSLVSSRLATQTAFMIQLMVLACTLEHQRQDGSSVRLMVQYPFHDSERETSFALRVARMLRSIWVGPNRLAQNVLLDSKHKTLPDDLVAWIVLSRWAIARAYLAGRDSAGILPKQIGDVARGVFTSTVALGPVELEAENKMMRELDARMGVKPSETEALVRYASDLRASTQRMRPDISSRTAATT